VAHGIEGEVVKADGEGTEEGEEEERMVKEEGTKVERRIREERGGG
jgi:hypothetical protein